MRNAGARPPDSTAIQPFWGRRRKTDAAQPVQALRRCIMGDRRTLRSDFNERNSEMSIHGAELPLRKCIIRLTNFVLLRQHPWFVLDQAAWSGLANPTQK
jgi:hypothetical protein